MLNNFNLKKRDCKERYIDFFVNLISCQKKALKYYNSILQPMLDFAGIKHDIFVTDSSHFISDFIHNLDPDQMTCIDFAVIYGDRIFNQVYNAFSIHQKRDKLMNIPIGFLPGGSANWICCALGGTNPYFATSLIFKGNIVKSDIYEANLDNHQKVYGTRQVYGIAWVVIENNQRKLFGRHRYLAYSLYKWIFSLSLPSFPVEILFKTYKQNNQEKEWIKNDKKWSIFLSVLTHEIRSTLSKVVLLPITRINNSKMIINLIDKWRKYDVAMYFFKFFVNKHLYQNKKPLKQMRSSCYFQEKDS